MSPETLTTTPEQLLIDWPDGMATAFPAAELRAAARDAASLRQMHDTGKIEFPDGLQIVDVAYVGAYGLNVTFSDGHDRAIYPFVYLRELRGLTTS